MTSLTEKQQGVFVQINAWHKRNESVQPKFMNLFQVLDKCKETGGKRTSDFDVIYYRLYDTLCPAVASLVYLHGLGEHAQHYEYLFSHFQRAGIRVHAFDWRGFGRSYKVDGNKTRLGWIGHLSPIAQCDLSHVLEQIETILALEWDSSLPRFIMGHSLGAFMTLLYSVFGMSEKYPIHGLICSAPPFELVPPTHPLTKSVGRFLLKWSKTLPLYAGTSPRTLTRNKDMHSLYYSDPLRHGWSTTGTSFLYFDFAEQSRDPSSTLFQKWNDLFHQSTSPRLLLTHGTADSTTSFHHSKTFVELVQSGNITFKPYPKMKHNLTDEPEREQVCLVYVDWIKQNL